MDDKIAISKKAIHKEVKECKNLGIFFVLFIGLMSAMYIIDGDKVFLVTILIGMLATIIDYITIVSLGLRYLVLNKEKLQEEKKEIEEYRGN